MYATGEISFGGFEKFSAAGAGKSIGCWVTVVIHAAKVNVLPDFPERGVLTTVNFDSFYLTVLPGFGYFHLSVWSLCR